MNSYVAIQRSTGVKTLQDQKTNVLQDTVDCLNIRGLFKKYRTFGRQKYNYLFGCLKP